MRFARTIALVGVGLLWFAFGPVVLLLGAAALYFRRVRAWLRPTRRVVGAWVVAVLALAGLAVVVPDGWVPIAPGAGVLASPGYVGRPVSGFEGVPGGPLGESPEVRTRSYGVDACRRIELDSHDRLVSLCGSDGAPVLRLVDRGNLHQLAVKELPTSKDAACPGAFYVVGDRAVVATHDQRLLVVATADADDDPDLTTRDTVALDIPDDDCVIGLDGDAQGRSWFVTDGGRVGVVDDGAARVLDLAEQVDRPLTVVGDAAYVVTAEAAYRIGPGPRVVWRVDQEHSATPAALPGDLVATTDDAASRLDVVVRSGTDGAEVCRVAVFEENEGAADRLVADGAGVIVQNVHGYAGVRSTTLGRTTAGGVARVVVRDGECTAAWTADVDAPSGAPAVAAEPGLVYAYTKRRSWVGVNAWYLTALDLETGRSVFSVRTGLGLLRDNHHGEVALGPEATAYVPVLGGFVGVQDRG
ncbi:hypothetical protein [Nocardioides caricicola]|uniref:Pyrroloquinoline-quinone binding quinoprotein n=1 Tax=Nocardioides caricicola TaxID=634770 RepID=A0ABW0MWI2_9ACTN